MKNCTQLALFCFFLLMSLLSWSMRLSLTVLPVPNSIREKKLLASMPKTALFSNENLSGVSYHLIMLTYLSQLK